MSDELRDRIARVLFERDQIRLEQRGYFKVEWGDNVADWDAYVKPWLDEAQAIIDEFGLTVEERPAHQCRYPGCVAHSTTDPRGFAGWEPAVVITEKRVVGRWEKQ